MSNGCPPQDDDSDTAFLTVPEAHVVHAAPAILGRCVQAHGKEPPPPPPLPCERPLKTTCGGNPCSGDMLSDKGGRRNKLVLHREPATIREGHAASSSEPTHPQSKKVQSSKLKARRPSNCYFPAEGAEDGRGEDATISATENPSAITRAPSSCSMLPARTPPAVSALAACSLSRRLLASSLGSTSRGNESALLLHVTTSPKTRQGCRQRCGLSKAFPASRVSCLQVRALLAMCCGRLQMCLLS